LTDGTFAIGRGQWQGDEVDFLDGAVDEVRLFDRALGVDEVTALAVPPADEVEVTPEAVTFSDEDGTESDTYTVPAVEGVEALVEGEAVEAGTYPGTGTVTVTAQALEGYVLAEGADTEWSHEFATDGGEEPGEPEPDTRTAEFHLSNTWRGTTDVHFMYGKWA